MIRYPFLDKGMTIDVTAPSSGVPNELHGLLHSAFKRMEEKGYNIQSGDTPWTQDQAKSAPAKKRAEEFNAMMLDDDVDIIIPPWGGELLVETLEYIDFNRIQNKWVLGYSDISLLLLAITLNTGIATAHGTNLVDLRGEYSDETTAMWESVLSTKKGESVLQHSSKKYQQEWDFENPTPHIFNLTEDTYWKTTTNDDVNVQGRLLGGCVDTIRHLIGTPYGDVKRFKDQHIPGESVIWFFENCELSTTDLRRTLVQMKLAGWFDDCQGILFGRSGANTPVTNYTVEDIYQELSKELQIPIINDVDCGHLPPQITFVNGAYAEIDVRDGEGQVVQTFKS
ncbi:S66 family peptidase [Alkalibacillus salilacus]|uniref:Muramoyltetrapeptide carboxypeptidase LdcA involved in peptidoglycan recycling n=1 Tax=Alkalibacillus salilacus TaxID=284582 RepID=A0ABT9VIJ1_9BACI|nr:S66 peptidase family protein [Alkalibacillus salilacus]MDQ0160793.1 muramoyltetrapeptide carboxypeptidase LdcA involved in peptidoglycan recycling [Alkalibacillus salilacus]